MLKKLMAVAAASLMVAGLAACNGARDTAVVMLDKDKSGHGFVKKVNARGRDYALFVPKGCDLKNMNKKYPMIVFLHGVGEGGSDITKPMSVGIAPFVADKADTFDFFVLIAQSSSGQWDENSDAASDVIEEIHTVCGAYPVDQERISLTGLSTGGYGTWAIGAKNSGLFSALVPMGSNSACTDATEDQALAKMNIWAIENSGDPFSGFQSNTRTTSAVNAAAGHDVVKRTIYDAGGHNCWERAYGDGELFQWLRSTTRKKSAAAPAAAPKSSAAPSISPVNTADASSPRILPTTPVKVEANSQAVVPNGPKTPY